MRYWLGISSISISIRGLTDPTYFGQVGKLADLVLWKPAFFGAKPELVVKGGAIAWANMGDPNASIPTPEPVWTTFLRYIEHSSTMMFPFISINIKENSF